ncbi:MAG: group 1 truncated hemoglobin, partial [Acidobacteria bacterium]|nr:group 1 truncated hemoglobin [Acidobacteriota bacterium]
MVVVLCLLGAMAVGSQAHGGKSAPAAAMTQKSLYERLGGLDAIKAVVGEFASRVLADERINKKFVKTDATRLTHFLVEQICA